MTAPADKHSRPDFRPPPRLILTTWQHFLAFGFGSGLAPMGPGTAGTLVAMPIWFCLQGLSLPTYAVILFALFAAGCWICGESARLLGVHDYGGIVFDEIVGYLATCLPLLPAVTPGLAGRGWWALAAFALFRLFDIWKPWPIRSVDRRVGGGFGIMIDDVIAAIYGAIVLEAGILIVAR